MFLVYDFAFVLPRLSNESPLPLFSLGKRHHPALFPAAPARVLSFKVSPPLLEEEEGTGEGRVSFENLKNQRP